MGRLSADAVVERLNAVGLELVVEGEGLRVRGPGAAFSPELRALVAEHRAELTAGCRGVAGCFPTPTRESETSLSLSSDLSYARRVEKDPATPLHPAADPTPVAHAEIRTLPISLTRGLPLPCTLLVRFAGSDGLSALTTSVAGAQRAQRGGMAVWSPDAFETLALAVQEGRAGAAEVTRLDGEKRRGLWSGRDGQRGDVALARALVAGADGLLTLAGRVEDGALSITWGELLDALGARLVEVICEQVAGSGASAAAGGEASAGAGGEEGDDEVRL